MFTELYLRKGINHTGLIPFLLNQYNVSDFQRSRVSEFQGFRVSGFQSFRVSAMKFPIHEIIKY
jgi:hypothetical protein